MNIEKRLKDHMSEQAQRIVVDSSDPTKLSAAAPENSYRTMSVMAAAIVVLLAGAGFWMLSNDDVQVTEIAAGDAEDVEESGGSDDENDGAGSSSSIPIQQIDVSSDLTPGYGSVEVEDGVYYVLSTAPGRVDLPNNPSDDQYAEFFRPRTFYVLGDDQQWQVSDVGDRFVSDFDVEDGVLYVVSTGTTTGGGAAFGSSVDQGQTWNWTAIDSLPESSQMNLLVTEQQSLIYAARYGMPDYDEAMAFANGAGLSVDEMTLRSFDGHGLSYIPIDPANRCDVIVAGFIPELGSFNVYLEEVESDEERASLEAERPEMISYFKEEVTRQGCEWDPAWETAEGVEGIEIPDPVYVPWADIGVTVPENWKSWSSLYSYDGQSFVDLGKPFNDEVQTGFANTDDGTLTISTYPPYRGNDNEIPTETRYSTEDGINWEQEVISFDQYDEYDDQAYYSGSGYLEPRAGEYLYRIWWEEAYEEGYDQQMKQAEELFHNGEITEEEMSEQMFLLQPRPKLQRRGSGGSWETVNIGDLAPDLNLDSLELSDVQGTSLGVFIALGNQQRIDGPPEPGLTVLHSTDGVNWSSFELEGNSITTHSTDDSVLVFSNRWLLEPGDEVTPTQAVLIRPGG